MVVHFDCYGGGYFVNMTLQNIHESVVCMECPSGDCHGYYVSYLLGLYVHNYTSCLDGRF